MGIMVYFLIMGNAGFISSTVGRGVRLGVLGLGAEALVELGFGASSWVAKLRASIMNY